MTADKRILKVSVTELQEFMRCQTMWDFQSANRQSLVQRGAPRKELWMGSAMHAALGAQIMGQDAQVALAQYIARMRKEIAEEYLRRVGAPMSTQEWEAFEESAILCERVIGNYFAFYGTTDTYGKNTKHPALKPIASEITFIVPWPDIAEGTEYDEVWLVGTIDALFLTDHGALVAADHKTFSQKADVRDLQLDHQFTGYSACLQMLTGQSVDHFLYNGVNKKVPGIPAVLKGAGPTQGRLSKAKIDTTHATYLQAIRDNGEDPADAYYSGHLAQLLERDQYNNVFFVRHYLDIWPAAVQAWIENTHKLLWQMAHNPPITYNRAWTGCWDCSVRELCDAKLKGQDLTWLTNESYTIGTYGTQQTLQSTASPSTVDSLDDLIAFSREQFENATG
jgi:hypothetical protein